MKRTLIFAECRQIQPKKRSLLHQLYNPGESPHILAIRPHQYVHTAWQGDVPVAAIASDYSDYATDQMIRLTHEAYRDRYVFRGLLDRLIREIRRNSIHDTTLLLHVKQDHDQDKRRMFEVLGFDPYHETVTYTLPLIPFQKYTYENWSLHVDYFATHSSWLAYRNQYAHMLTDVLPLTASRLLEHERRQEVFHSLKLKGKIVGIMRSRIGSGRLDVYELHVSGSDELIQEAVSFIQQEFYFRFRSLEQIRVTLTSLQPELRYALIRQGGSPTQAGTYTMIKEVAPSAPSFPLN
ncbi:MULTISPECIES: hypothetical protein [unclassified Exiguobacterium]|uniref:hypothetical protein n=1 Tax=unclassified Exiguobacterium TaxID=2644629 RepID=UPI00103E9504|nr:MULTISPECIES: hypothetical protein [unclassified Exiguobacterium]TCI35113.1 hypothetical protein EVJ29_10735 [Exiguobacterium sp. SH4S7]TCI59808.1 hypothetical protein EVJ21_12840 [Exiguobacterium sp. SH0S2]